jgi:hypothetical protein
MECSFFVTEDALKRMDPGMRLDATGILKAFDSNREGIRAAACKVYARGTKGSYELGADDVQLPAGVR